MNVGIAICDDNRQDASRLEQMLEPILDNITGLTWETNIYETGEGLLRAMEDAPYALLFLDMEMPAMDGISLAESIRMKHRDVLIIFVTSHARYMQRSFEVQPFRYLMKPVSRGELEAAVRKATGELLRSRNWLSFEYKRTVYRLRTDDLLYATVERGKKLVLITERESYGYYGKLGELEKRLAPFSFCRIHTGFLVHWRYVRSLSKESATLRNGTVLPVGRTRSESALHSYHCYMEKRFLP